MPQMPAYKPPNTPQEHLRQNEQISTLLEINNYLLEHSASLVAQGRGPSPSSTSGDDTMRKASPEFQRVMRTIQANISWILIAQSHGQAQSKASSSPGPIIMTPPVAISKLTDLYKKLQDLFPGWTGASGALASGPQQQPSAQQQQQQQQQQQHAGTQHSQQHQPSALASNQQNLVHPSQNSLASPQNFSPSIQQASNISQYPQQTQNAQQQQQQMMMMHMQQGGETHNPGQFTP